MEQRKATQQDQMDLNDSFPPRTVGSGPATGSLKSLLDRLDRDAPERSVSDKDPMHGLREARMKIAELTGAPMPSALSQLAAAQRERVPEPESKAVVQHPVPAVSSTITDALNEAINAAPVAPPTYASKQPDKPHVPVVVETEMEDEEDLRRSKVSMAFGILGLLAAVGTAGYFTLNQQQIANGQSWLGDVGTVLAGAAKSGAVPTPKQARPVPAFSMDPKGGAGSAVQSAQQQKTANLETGAPKVGSAPLTTPETVAPDIAGTQPSNGQPAGPAAQSNAATSLSQASGEEGVSAHVSVRPGDRIPLPLNLDPVHVSADVSAVLVRGLPADYSISGATGAGEGRWAVLAETIDEARLEIPASGAGRIKLNVDMFNSEAQLIAQTVVIVDVVAQNAQRRMSQEKMDQLLAQGKALFASGDVASARLVFERAAEGGHGPSAFALAETFEPERLKSMAVQGLSGDPARARHWYQQAQALGVPQAGERLAGLTDK